MKSASRNWIFLCLILLLQNCGGSKLPEPNKVVEYKPMEKAYVLLRTEGSENNISQLKDILNSDFVTNNISTNIVTYPLGRAWNNNQIFTTAYNDKYDYIVLIDQVAKFTIDNKTQVGGKYQIRSYHIKSPNPDWIDLGQKTCNITIKPSIKKFAKQIVSNIVPSYKPSTISLNEDEMYADSSSNSVSDYQTLKTSKEIDSEIEALKHQLELEKEKTNKVIAEKERLQKQYEEALAKEKKKTITALANLELAKKEKDAIAKIQANKELETKKQRQKEIAESIAAKREEIRKREAEEALKEPKVVVVETKEPTREEKIKEKQELKKRLAAERALARKKQEEEAFKRIQEKRRLAEEKRKKQETLIKQKKEEKRLAQAKKDQELLDLEKQKEEQRLAELAEKKKQEAEKDEQKHLAKEKREKELLELEKQKEDQRLAELAEIKKQEAEKDEQKRLAKAKKDKELLELEKQKEEQRLAELAEIKKQEAEKDEQKRLAKEKSEKELLELEKQKEEKAIAEANLKKELEKKRLAKEERRLAQVKKEEEEFKRKQQLKEKRINTPVVKKSSKKRNTNSKAEKTRDGKTNALVILRAKKDDASNLKKLQDNIEFDFLFAKAKATTLIYDKEHELNKLEIVNNNNTKFDLIIIVDQLDYTGEGFSNYKISTYNYNVNSNWNDLEIESCNISDRVSIKQFSKTIVSIL